MSPTYAHHQEMKAAFGLEPQYRDYVWGGSRLRPGQQTAEAWIVFEQDTIRGGALAGRTLAEVAEAYGPLLLGEHVVAMTGLRFPLLIKLLDCAQWLSLQVHPNDEQAERLAGPGHFGKTEAWYVLEADDQAKILAGFKPGADRADWQSAVRNGSILDYAQSVDLHSGDTVFIRPGTLHALGPGLLVYEVQQTSDITYRVFDWNRPASAGRKLHIDESLVVLDPSASGKPVPPPEFSDGAQRTLITCPYFTLAMLMSEHKPLALDPQGQTFHLLTVVEGQAELEGEDWTYPLGSLYQTVVVPAGSGPYQVRASGRTRLLKASVENIE